MRATTTQGNECVARAHLARIERETVHNDFAGTRGIGDVMQQVGQAHAHGTSSAASS